MPHSIAESPEKFKKMSPYFEDGKAEHNIDSLKCKSPFLGTPDYMSMGFVIAWCDITIEPNTQMVNLYKHDIVMKCIKMSF